LEPLTIGAGDAVSDVRTRSEAALVVCRVDGLRIVVLCLPLPGEAVKPDGLDDNAGLGRVGIVPNEDKSLDVGMVLSARSKLSPGDIQQRHYLQRKTHCSCMRPAVLDSTCNRRHLFSKMC
jgi:hypothetical protein